MTWLEVVGVVFGFIAIWLTVREDWRCWPAGLACVAAYAAVFWEARLYAAAVLQILYAALALYGWHSWVRGGEDRGALKVTRSPRRALAGLLAAGTVAAVILGTALRRFTDAALPASDAATTAFSLVAQALQTRKWIENWLIWIAVDAVYLAMYLSQGLYLTTLLYAAFLVLAVLGWRAWRRSMAPAASA
ncbi:MAG: nicotinamide riboside transporter PnuC [Vicinamibacterales bacterium]